MIEKKHRQCLAFMENDTTLTRKGLLEPVTPGSVTFESSILAPLQSNYLYEESKEYFTYHSAHLIVNRALCSRYSDFCAEKRANGYSNEQLEESFGFLLCDDESRVIRLAETGLNVGQSTCTTLGDCSKGVYISKYSDCLDLKRWYDGKKGFIVLFKLTKGRIKEVTENYTQNFTPPSAGFDCHVSEQIRAVCATTSSFLAFERTQYYMYELLDGGSKVDPCPRHVCPFATVAFSYGKPTISLKEKRQEKASFQYQPWRGQLQIGSISYNISMQSSNGAMFPANLPKTIEISRAVSVSELKKTLPQTIFETSLLGEVPLDGRWFSLYDVMSLEAKPDLSLLTQELKSKDMALVVCLKDNGILVFLHSSNFLSYEGVGAEKACSLQGMFIFPDTRSVPRETKISCKKKTPSAEVLQVLPALNYAESEMEKCPLKQQEEPLVLLERHLQNFAALILPGLPSSPGREASMFPDQYDVPNGFSLIAPKWTAEAGDRLKSYLEKPRSFEISLSRVLALLASGKQQRTDDHDDDVYYYISSPEAPQTPAYIVFEREPASESEQVYVKKSDSGEVRNAEKQTPVPSELSASALPEKIKVPDTTPSPRIGDSPAKHYSNEMTDSKKALDSDPGECRNQEMEVSLQTEADADGDLCKKVPHSTPVDEAQISKEAQLETTSSMTPTESSSTSLVESQSTTILRRPGRRRKRKALKRILKPVNPIPSPFPNTTLLDGLSVDSTSEGSNKTALPQTPLIEPKKDWRSLPRRRKHWKADNNIRRSLRSDIGDMVKEAAANLGENVLSNRLWEHTPKRKMEGVNMRERYGLKTIITDCGRVFVPHGSDVATVGNKSGEHANTQETPFDTESSPATGSLLEKENNDHHVPLTHIENIPLSPFAKMGSEVRSHDSPETLESNLKPTSPGKTKSNTKQHVYKAISISKLKTVLKRARTKPPGTKDSGKSDDPDLKKKKADVDVNLNLGEEIQQSYKSLKTSAQEMLLSKLAKENGGSIFDNSSPFDIVKQADQQLISAIIGDRVGGKLISPDGKGAKEGLAIGLAVPSDALNLLADLALSVNTDKTAPNAATKPGQEVHAGAKTCDSPKSVLHNLLRGSARLRLPAKSPFPEGLVVTGDLILEISKEHSYSQPSLTSSLLSPSKTHLTLHSRVPLDLPDETGSSVRQQDKAENGLGSPVQLDPPTLDTTTKLQKFVFLRQRHVVEKEGSIKVTRFWKDDYDFRFDSKFTNEKLDKCVTRALHGKWDFQVEDTFEQVHLIFHMWIGLFYSKPTSRFFNFDHNYPILERKDPTQVLLNNVPPTAPALGSDFEDKGKSLHPISDALDLSVKVVSDDENHADEQTSGVENATPSSCIRSEMETTRENKEADCNASGQPQIVFMDYRSNVEVLNEKSASADNDPSDFEDDIGDATNDSYTELLDNNSAYTRLCDETSEMAIDEQKSLQRKAFNSKSLAKTLRIKTDGMLASGSAVSVFHQVVSTVRPTILFKTNEPPGKNKSLIKALSFKYRTRGVASAHVSKHEEQEAVLSKDTTINTDQNKSVLEPQTGSCSEKSPAASCDQNHDSGMESELDGAKESMEDHSNFDGGKVTDQPVNNIPTDELNVDAKETNDVIPVTNDSSLHKETSAAVSDDEEVVSVTPLQDVDASKSCELHDDAKDADETVHAAHSCSTIDEQDVSAKQKEVDVRNDMIVREQDVNNTSEEGVQDVEHGRDDEPKLEVSKQGTTVEELPEDTEAPVADVVEATVDPAPSALTCDEGAKGFSAEMSCSGADSGEQSKNNESWTDACVDMDISDGQTSEEESQGKDVHFGETSLEEVDLRTEKGAEPIEDPKSDGGDDAPSSDHVTTMDRFICPDDGATSFPTSNNSESTMPPLCSVAQQNPEVSRDDATMMITDVTRETFDRSEGHETLNTNIYHQERPDPEMHEEAYTQDASPLGLHIDTESEYSRSCTPTQDELPVNEALYSEHGDESQLQDKYSPEHEYQQKDSIDIPFPQEVPTSSSVATYETTVPESSDHQLQDISQDSYWSYCQYDPSRLDEQANMSVDMAYKASSQLEDLASTRPQQDQFEDFLPEEYEDSAELPSSWDHGYEAEGLYRLKGSYSFVEEEEDWHNLKKTVYKPKRPSLSESDRLKRMGFSDSTESSERFRSHRQRKDSSESDKTDNRGSGSVSHKAKRPTTSRPQDEQDEAFDDDDALNFSVRRTISSSTVRTSIVRRPRSCPYQHKSGKHPFDWRRYFRRGGIFESNKGDDGVTPELPSLVTFLNKKGDRVIFEKPATQKRWADVRGMSPGVGDSLLKYEDKRTRSDFTQPLMELEYLIFSEKMTHLLKHKPSSRARSHKANATPAETPLTIKFSKLDEQDSFVTFDKGWPAITKCKISVDMSERKGLKTASDYGKPFHLRSLYCKKGSEAACSKISEITKDCVKSYHSMMNDICTGKTFPHRRQEVQRKWDGEATASGKQAAFCGRIKNDMFNNLHDNLNSIVRQTSKIKYNFYILVTSRDPFFEETKDLLEAEGHTAVEPYDFDLDVNGQNPLLIIMRNEDIAEYICKVPYLLELKKSSRVLFAGIDRPDDVVNLTHQELFARGGFVVFDESAMDALSLENMKNIVGIMEELDKKGKWKWYLHYRNSRKLRENARCSPEAQRRKQFIDCCQEAGIAEVLPYHECDVISRDRPDYLRCLVHLQIQNISARFPIFITDTPDDSFATSGIFTMTVHTFSRILSNGAYKAS